MDLSWSDEQLRLRDAVLSFAERELADDVAARDGSETFPHDLWGRCAKFGILGLPVPEEGLFSRLKRLGVAPTIVDKAVIESIKERRIEIVAGVESLDETGLTLTGGSRVEPDAVIAATGYRTGLAPTVGHLGVLDERGVPRGGEPAPGLHFVGYVPRPAHVGYMGQEAKRAAKAIARARPGVRTAQPITTARGATAQ